LNAALWTEQELIGALGATPRVALRAPVGGVSIDTRTLAPGDLFFAIKGDAQDGHDYVARAFAAGAAACVVSRQRAPELSAHGPLFAVDDPLRAMERLGVAARARTRARIVAVTGSVGKTSAKEMLRVILSKTGATHASAASYNNHWGVPLTLARMPADTAFGVFEIGMNHANEIAPLVAMVRPHVALITTIAPVHVEHLGSIEAIAEAKAEIFVALEPKGVAVLNRDAPQYELLEARARAQGAQIMSFGADEEADAKLLRCDPLGEGARVRACIGVGELSFPLGAPGVHMAHNALGALLAAKALGADLLVSAAAMAEFAPPKGRGERFTLASASGPIILIDESYNANPASMRAALTLLGATQTGKGGRRIAALGDMLELGPQGAAMHADLAGALIAAKVDLLFCAGPLMRALYEAAPAQMRGGYAPSAAELEPDLVKALRGGDVVMIKGSNGARMGPLAASLRQHFARADTSA
jgi:UDP-N-acetylmuramoyl-tripeptide--D-alanyl-D-alanine ligase